MGLFRTFIIMRMKGVRSLREMTRLLDADQRIRRLCLLKPGEAAYPRTVLSRFTRKVGEENLNKIINEKVAALLKSNRTKKVDVVLDASFIKACARATYALFSILCLVLNREAAQNIGRKDKAVSPTYFNT